jgi:hypothetical protein
MAVAVFHTAELHDELVPGDPGRVRAGADDTGNRKTDILCLKLTFLSYKLTFLSLVALPSYVCNVFGVSVEKQERQKAILRSCLQCHRICCVAQSGVVCVR